MKSPHRLYLEKIIKENKQFIKGLILNVGGGTKAYKDIFSKMVNMDLYDHNQDFSKINMDVKANITKTFPFKNQVFDSVICTEVLEHVLDPKKVIEEIYASLKYNGNLILSVPFLCRYHPDPKDFWRFTEDGLSILLAKKFKIKKIIPIGGRNLLFLNILYQHRQIPRFVIKLLYPLVQWFTSFEKHKSDWSAGFFVIAEKI